MKICFLSNYSIEFIFDSLKKKLASLPVEAEIFYPGFNQFSQQIFNPSSELYEQKPELIFLSVDFNYYLNHNFELNNNPPISSIIKDQIEQFFEAIKIISHKLKNSIVLIDNFYLHHSFSFGSLEYNYFGLEKFIDELNLQLSELSSERENIRIINIKSLISRYGQESLFDSRLNYLAKFKWNKKGIDVLTNLYISHIKAYLGLRKKCIAVDLDNTLWGGIIGQDGIENIQLSNDGAGKAFYDFQLALLNYHQQGIILAICSKNSENVVNEVFEKHPYMVLKPEHFASMKINWNNKTENLIEIAKELNIGLDSIVFLDDSKFERELIKKSLPMIAVPELPEEPAFFAEFLKSLDFFNFHKLTDDDFKRNESYKINLERKKLEGSFSDITEYLRSLEMKIKIEEINSFTFPRIAQLIQKTNQFNTTTKRYTEAELKEMWDNKSWRIYSFSVEDKFGDNGIVGIFILKIKEAEKILDIDSFIMSCRVIGRNIEKAILHFIYEQAKLMNLETIIGEIIPTPKNEPCRKVYQESDFQYVENVWRLNMSEKKIELPEYFQLISL